MVALLGTACGRAFGAAAGDVLRGAAASCGEGRWEGIGGIAISGRVERFGLHGRYGGVVDLRNGRFAWRSDTGAFFGAEGLDGSERWRMDWSRRVHTLNSGEAKTLAVTEAYLARRGYLHAGEPAALVALGLRRDASSGWCDVVGATPPHGRTALLWIGRGDRLVRRIDIRRSERVETIRYGDYREVGGVKLPFSIVIDDGDEPDTASISVSSYRFLRQVASRAVEPPIQSTGDARILTGSSASVPLSVDAMSGFPVVYASVNGRAAMPFIMDTGGHDIVTSDAARRLGLKSRGRGISSGVGSGSTATAFTRVRSVKVGGAVMAGQPFVVLHLDLGSVMDARGRSAPIAGILGLELFERFTVGLDFPGRRCTLRIAGDDGGGAHGAVVLPIRFTSDEPLVGARIDGHPGSFGVDTGNNVGLIVFRRWLGESGVSLLFSERDGASGSSVGGQVSFRDARAKSVWLGGLALGDVPVSVSDMQFGSLSSRSEAGSIGTPFLSRFCVTFDYAGGWMSVRGQGRFWRRGF